MMAEPKQVMVETILEIYRDGEGWWAHVLTESGEEEHVLRDSLRVGQPKLLLDHY